MAITTRGRQEETLSLTQMRYLAFRNLWQQKFRLALSVASVALATMLIILLTGFLAGILRQVTAYLDHTPADYVVAEDGVGNFLSATSLLPGGAAARARSVPGVDQVIPIVSQFVILDIHDQKVVAYMVGYEPGIGGGPWRLLAGRPPAADDEVVLDWVMAQQHGFTLDATIEILDQTFTVVGLSDGTNSWMASFFFVEKRAAEKLLMTPDATSFLLLTLRPDADVVAVEARLHRRLRQMEVLPVATVKRNDANLIVEVFAMPLRLMVAIAFAVGVAILSMVIYSATVERAREYGVLKAVGAQNGHLYRLVTYQALASALLGLLLGMGLAWLVGQWIVSVAPKFQIVIVPGDVLRTALSGLVMGVLAAWLPAYQVGRLDPAAVFRK